MYTESKEVTVCLTSTGRWDLLRITIESFLKFNTYDIKRFIVNDDSGEPVPVDLQVEFDFIHWYSVAHKNQISSLDYLWSQVSTPYAFTMEDDWEFLKEGFIEKSLKILEADPTILQVWLMQPEPHNVSPIDWSGAYGVFKRTPDLWAWHRFNPSLKRKADYDLIAPFSKHTEWNPAKPWKSEADISKVYHKLGFSAAILPASYIRHLGQNRHISP